MSFIFSSVTIFIHNYFLLNLVQSICFTFINISLLFILYNWGFLSAYPLRRNWLVVFIVIISFLGYALQYNRRIQIPYSSILGVFIWILAAIHLLVVKLVNGTNDKYRASKILIILPIIISSIYFLVLQILMAFLFNAETKALFKELYYVVNYLNVFSYICFTIALLWAPNKEQYL